MKQSLSSLDLHFLARELEGLVGARLQKVYQGTGERKRDLLFLLHRKDSEKGMLRVVLPGLVYAASERPEYDVNPGPFATFLRKFVGNARLVGVEQQGFERILHLKVENKNGIFTIVLELIPPGNALILNAEGKIVNLLEPQKTSSRVLRGGAIYEPPPQLFDTKAATADAIAERLFASTKDSIVKSLAIDLGLGGEYAEEICLRAGVEKSRKDLSREELRKISVTIRSIFDDALSPSTTDGDAFPITMAAKAAAVAQPSFSHAIETVVPLEPAPKKEVAVKTRKSKAEDVVKQQEAALVGLLRSADENQRKGELIYERYQEVERLLREINEARKTMGWREIKERLKPKGIAIDEAKGEATIELAEKRE